MLKIHDYSRWKKIYETELDAALELIAPETVDGPDEGRKIIAYDIPFRTTLELYHLSTHSDYVLQNQWLTERKKANIGNARPIIHEVISYAASGRSSIDNLSFEKMEYASFIQMLLENPLAILVKTVGEATLQVSTYHGFTTLRIEKAKGSLRAKISHHQNDPTYIYGMPEVLESRAWECTYHLGQIASNDANTFQAIYYLPDLDFNDAMHAILSSFALALSNSIHNLGKFSEADGAEVRLNLEVSDTNFDDYLLSNTDFVQKFWLHHYLHVRLNQRLEHN